MSESLQNKLEGEERMTGTWRPLVLAAALIVTMAAAATAQTVIVTRTPPGTAVELGVNATPIGNATSDAKGVASIPLNTLQPRAAASGKTEMDVRVFVDVCEKKRNVWLTETGWQPPAIAAGCTRREMFGVFSLLQTTSIVVEAAEANQAVWIRQGPVPSAWLDPNAQVETPRESNWEMATGLILFAGTGPVKYIWTDLVGCGTNNDVCTPNDWQMAYRTGVDFWLNRFVAVTGGYFKALEWQARGSGSGYRFKTTLTSDVATVGVKGGISISRVRVYLDVGGTYQRSNLQTTQSVNPITGSGTNGETIIVSEGGTQVFNMQTSGMNWYLAGGLEVWVKRNWGLYTEVGRMGLHGTPRAGGEGGLEDTLGYAVTGIRLRVR
jgi:hypothetical protein